MVQEIIIEETLGQEFFWLYLLEAYLFLGGEGGWVNGWMDGWKE